MPALSIREFYRFVAWIVGAIGCLALSQLAGGYLLHHNDAGAGLKILVLLGGVACYLPWVTLIAWLIRKSDEFERQVHLIGLAYSFGIAFFTLVLIDLLKNAGVIGGSFGAPTVVVFVIAWAIGLIVASRQFKTPE